MLATRKEQIDHSKALKPGRGIVGLGVATASVLSLDPGAVRVWRFSEAGKRDREFPGTFLFTGHRYEWGQKKPGLELCGFQLGLSCVHSRVRALDLWPRLPVHLGNLGTLGHPVW